MDRETEIRIRAYRRAQRAIAELKSATVDLLATAGPEGLRNAQIGRLLGIYQGHVRHQGHISTSSSDASSRRNCGTEGPRGAMADPSAGRG